MTSIDISFDGDVPYDTNLHDKMKALVASIHHAPSLKKIFFKSVPIRISDMETLHGKTPNLKSVKLDFVDIYIEDSKVLIGMDPAENITSFSMRNIKVKTSGEEDEEVEDALDIWISYVGKKCIRLEIWS